ncbi:hypothetical protein Agabi119p4_10494 [Agaricus bisporus var. burnettii]|uniref:Uncharacterized protein n=1 Tax=Agaricus bisporus var. burnettii TaxID=192524 RepID=A0A8H7C314_AGABI|nr:hypothetical protein Agabi119p4_10494 [Agaricus bisporus var. burnettii]
MPYLCSHSRHFSSFIAASHLRPRLVSRHCQLRDSFATETYSDPTIADNQDAIIILHSKSATPRRFFRGGVAVRPAPGSR